MDDLSGDRWRIILVGQREGKISFGRHKRDAKIILKMDYKKMKFEGTNWKIFLCLSRKVLFVWYAELEM